MCAQRSVASERSVSSAKPASSTDAGTAAAVVDNGGGLVVAAKPFYPEVTVSHVETPSKFYVMELSRKDSFNE